MFKPSTLAAILAACPLLPAVAANELPNRIVTAARISQSVDDTLSSVQVIDRAILDRHPGQDLGDVIRLNTNGIDIVRSGGLGQQTSIFTRGTNSNHTLVLIDGVRINSATSAQASIQSLAVNDVERVEIVKGPMSVLYGSDAIGGVINIITRRPEKNGGRINVTGGDDRLAMVDAGADFRSGNVSGRVDAGLTRTDGHAFVEGLPMNRGYENRNGSALLQWDTGSAVIDLQVRHNAGTTEYVNWNLAPLDQDFLNEVVSLGVDADLGDTWNSRFKLSRMRDEIDQNQNANRAHSERTQADWQNSLTWAAQQTLLLGLTAEQVDTAYNQAYIKEEDNTALFLQSQNRLGDASVQAAVRRDHNDRFGNHNTGHLGLGYALSPTVRVYANAGSAFRAPDFNNLYGWGGNPALQPETSRSLEVGSRLGAGRISGQVALFKTRVDDLIVSDANWVLQNLDRARMEGVEASLNWQPAPCYFTLLGSYVKATDDSTGADLDRRPRRTLNVQGGYLGDQWNLGLAVLAKSRTRDFGGELPGYAVLNLNAGWQVAPPLMLQLAIENLLNKEYSAAHFGTNVRYLAKPISSSLSATVRF